MNKWTTGRPTEPGWYWYKTPIMVEVAAIQVFERALDPRRTLLAGRLLLRAKDYDNAIWQGPIEPPKPPESSQ